MLTKSKRPKRNALRDYRPKATPPKPVAVVPPVKDSRPIVIIGRKNGAVVASDSTDCPRKAASIRSSWTESGLAVTVDSQDAK